MFRIVSLLSILLLLSCKTAQEKPKFINPEQNKVPVDVVYSLDEVDGKLQLNATNKRLMPIEFELKDKVSGELTKTVLIQPSSKETLYQYQDATRATAIEKFKSLFDYNYYFGDASTIKPDQNYLYRLPFADDKSYKVVQSFGGKSSHSTESSYHAIDFDMTYGEPVHAARAGLVVVAIDWFSEGGKKEELTKKANKVVILHDDGTTGSYAHLDYKKVFVKEGQRVEKGQLLGEAGNTGFSGGAHLHFVVREGRGKSMAIYFEDYPHEVLKRGKKYSISHK